MSICYLAGNHPGLVRAGAAQRASRMQFNPGRDLWGRLAALDQRCIVKLESYYTGFDPIRSLMRWRVTIIRRDSAAAPFIVAEGATAVEAAEDGLDRAEFLGWHAA